MLKQKLNPFKINYYLTKKDLNYFTTYSLTINTYY